ncbi:MAG: RDD family protein [Pirellulaceae bacterium]
MSTNDHNPYSAPYQQPVEFNYAPQRPLADLGKRFLGAVVDILAGFVCLLPGYALMIAAAVLSGDPDQPQPALFFVGVILVIFGALVPFVLQIYFLVTRSQSIGKIVMKTQIVDVNTGQPADWVHSWLLRVLVNGLIASIPCLGFIYALTDILFIFREDRRCLHDLLANTVVVDIS